MLFAKNMIKGIFLGAGAILPGLSSGVLCVVFGIYEDLIHSLLHFFQDFKKNLLFLLPLGLGGLIGVVLVGNILSYFFRYFEIPTKLLFLGLILGSIPSLCKEAKLSRVFRLHDFLYTIISFGITFALWQLENYFSVLSANPQSISFLYLVFCGFAMSIGVVVPGVSSTAILMCLGIYFTYLDAISSLQLTILFPMGIGLIIGCILFLLAIQYFLKHFHTQTYCSIIGFVLGSIFFLLPDFAFDFSHMIGYLCFILSFCLMLSFSTKQIPKEM